MGAGLVTSGGVRSLQAGSIPVASTIDYLNSLDIIILSHTPKVAKTNLAGTKKPAFSGFFDNLNPINKA